MTKVVIFPGVRIDHGEKLRETPLTMKLKRNLQIIWRETATPIGTPAATVASCRRYIARARNGGPAWGVWDRVRDRFLSDREVRGLDENEIRETWAN